MDDKFGTDLAAELGTRIQRVCPDFPVDAMIDEVAQNGQLCNAIRQRAHEDKADPMRALRTERK